MTTDDFCRIALSLPGTEELNGLGYPNFRTGRKSFATIEDSKAVIRLTPDQQAAFVAAAPAVFEPVSSGWDDLAEPLLNFRWPTRRQSKMHSPQLGAMSPMPRMSQRARRPPLSSRSLMPPVS
jgi:hypothetical protein